MTNDLRLLMNIPFYQVDAFANEPFQGNTAGVCILYQDLSDKTLQDIAAENNVAATAFVYPSEENFRLRWFTPSLEVPLCGHATLASAHVIWEAGLSPLTRSLIFQTRSGLLTAAYQPDGWIEMDFPAIFHSPAHLPEDLLRIFPTEPVQTVEAQGRYLIELPSEAAVRSFIPDFQVLKNYQCIITSRADEDSAYDVISRYFAVPLGVSEDPVTGSAHCCLAPYWAGKLGKSDLLAYQASARGGELKLKLINDRVRLAGRAVTVIQGTWKLRPLDK